MMLYVFHVDTGTMITFDMRLVSESVGHLKEAVEKSTNIPVEKQVLLISGGECLDAANSIGSYAAGTDTNPIFLFSKAVLEAPVPPSSNSDSDIEDDTAERIKEAIDLPPSFNTVHRRAMLSQQLHERAKEQIQLCERLVHDQHLQQQGWSAVVASLEDLTAEFKKRTTAFSYNYTEYLKERDTYIKFLDNFHDDLSVLEKIPILPVLIAPDDEADTGTETSKEDDEDEEETDTRTSKTSSETGEGEKTKTLLDWISVSEDKSNMDQLYEVCLRGLEQFSDLVCNSMDAEILEVLTNADNNQMKEIKGLGERLSGLETLMREAKKYVLEQAENAKSFTNNQHRVSNLKDASILPDLCGSHRRLLYQMAQNHQQLCDIRRRCTKAKEELSQNLFHRLKWVMFIQNKLVALDQKLVIFHQSLCRLRRHLDVLQQIHLTPATYLCAVAEVVRRKLFSQSFLMWASDVACQLLTIHNDEVARRKEFQSQFEGHFLVTLFPGMNDLPPPFATQAPAPFDGKLPHITRADVDRLRAELPEFAEHLAMPDTSGFTNFFLTKSLVKAELDKVDESGDIKEVEKKLVQVMGAQLEGNLPHGLPHLRDIDRGCESETDTEEFEKVGQSPLDPSPRPGTQDAATCTEDNLQISRSEHEKLKGTLETLGHLSTNAINQLRAELTEIRHIFLADKEFLESGYKSITMCQSRVLETCKADQVATENLISSHESEVSSLKNMCSDKEDDLNNVKIANIVMEQKLQKTNDELAELKSVLLRLKEDHHARVEELRKQLSDKESEKEKMVKDVTDRLNREHKAELENIRSRFKLMTRSPSDSSLEKIGDFSSIPNHETILLQMKETFEIQRDWAVKEAVEQERSRWEKLLDERIAHMEEKFAEEKRSLIEDLSRKIGEEKEKQIDVLRERERNLNLEIIKYKGTIQQLTEAEMVTSSTDTKEKAELQEKFDNLKRENEALKRDLDSIKKPASQPDMTASVAVIDSGAQTIPEGAVTSTSGNESAMTASTVESMCESTTSTGTRRSSKSYTERCVKGLKVEIYWDESHHCFRLDLEGKLYFLHCDYLPAMGLEIVNGAPNKQRVFGEVIEKEYCMSKKDDNRYNVPKGKKFFRVKVKPAENMDTSTWKDNRPVSIPEDPVEESEQQERPEPETQPVESTAIIEPPEEILPESIEKIFHDSGVVEEVVEEAAVAIENLSSDDRYLVSSNKLVKKTNWLGMVVSSIFGKNEPV
ncbi:unnamed protein product [Brassicogethes aeneus]|uniref:RB1-inducible coiled-coil protein 1 n=1 Tax=Brassicogethes aeneus TaxID=1431903 RepID=A0A9P0FIV2_BRAAE|nr:unnamed protein product [Brassicogethes aeneus]